MLRSIRIATLLSAFIILGVLLWSWQNPAPNTGHDHHAQHGGIAPPTHLEGLGGGFTLVDSTGQPVTEKDFHGRYMLVFFGFTHCPDICPLSLAVMRDARALLPAHLAAQIAPIFITLDPERDTPAVMADYIALFATKNGTDIIALTGSPEQIADVARSYRVYYRKTFDAAASDYIIDHSVLYYLMDPNARYAAHFDRGITPEALAEKLTTLIAH